MQVKGWLQKTKVWCYSGLAALGLMGGAATTALPVAATASVATVTAVSAPVIQTAVISPVVVKGGVVAGAIMAAKSSVFAAGAVDTKIADAIESYELTFEAVAVVVVAVVGFFIGLRVLKRITRG